MQSHGMSALRDNPELMGTSVGMLRRAAAMLKLLCKVPEAARVFARHEHRLLQHTMSQLVCLLVVIQQLPYYSVHLFSFFCFATMFQLVSSFNLRQTMITCLISHHSIVNRLDFIIFLIEIPWCK